MPGEDAVAVVDLHTMSVAYHATEPSLSALERLRRWVAPAARADGGGPVAGRHRLARWLAPGILVSGSDTSPTPDGGSQQSRPAGLRLIDPVTWESRPLGEAYTSFATSGGRVLATGDRERPRIYLVDRDGLVPTVELPERGGLTLVGDRVYVGLGDEYRPHRVAVYDARDAQLLTRARAPGWVSVLDPERPHVCWCDADP